METNSIWSWMKKVLKENVPTILVADTPENRIREKRYITTVRKIHL